MLTVGPSPLGPNAFDSALTLRRARQKLCRQAEVLMAEVRVFCGARVVADFTVEAEGWDVADGELLSSEADVIAHVERAVVRDGHMNAEDAEGATYMVSQD